MREHFNPCSVKPRFAHGHAPIDRVPSLRCANRRRVGSGRGKKLQRLRSELTERSFAHVCETGGGRRCWLRGLVNVAKRYVIMVAARNLGLIMRKLFGTGTPRGLQKGGGLFVWTHLATYWLLARWRPLCSACCAPTPRTTAA
jgi:hypothetical protein